jgi:hypothetical protein
MLEALERQVRDARERAEQAETTRNTAFERQIESFEQQRLEYNSKIDKLQQDSLDKDRLVAQLQLKIERLGDEIERRKQETEVGKVAGERERKSLTEKLDQTKKKLSETQDEAMKQRLELGREQALQK